MVILPDLWRVLIYLPVDLVHCAVVQRHNFADDLSIVVVDVCSHHGNGLQASSTDLK